eukprot:5879716-Ditylum_brightwellii.AAC.1
MAFSLGVKPSIENKLAQTGSFNMFGAFLFGKFDVGAVSPSKSSGFSFNFSRGETEKKEELTIKREVKEEESKELYVVEDKGEI